VLYVALEEVFSQIIILHKYTFGKHTLFTHYILMNPLDILCFFSDYIKFNSRS